MGVSLYVCVCVCVCVCVFVCVCGEVLDKQPQSSVYHEYVKYAVKNSCSFACMCVCVCASVCAIVRKLYADNVLQIWLLLSNV